MKNWKGMAQLSNYKKKIMKRKEKGGKMFDILKFITISTPILCHKVTYLITDKSPLFFPFKGFQKKKKNYSDTAFYFYLFCLKVFKIFKRKKKKINGTGFLTISLPHPTTFTYSSNGNF